MVLNKKLVRFPKMYGKLFDDDDEDDEVDFTEVVTSLDVKNGIDIQGINWLRKMETREEARLKRTGPDLQEEETDDDSTESQEPDVLQEEEEAGDLQEEADSKEEVDYSDEGLPVVDFSDDDMYPEVTVTEGELLLLSGNDELLYDPTVVPFRKPGNRFENATEGQQLLYADVFVPGLLLSDLMKYNNNAEEEEVKTSKYRGDVFLPRLRQDTYVETKAAEDVNKSKAGGCFDFFLKTGSVKPIRSHEHLTHMVRATSAQDVYVMTDQSIVSHWSSATRSLTSVETKQPSEDHYLGDTPKGFDYEVTVSAFDVNGNLLVVGGCDGELICKHLDKPGVIYSTTMSWGDNQITTSIQIHDREGILVTNNDGNIRLFDTESFQPRSVVQFGRSVNTASLSPDGRLIVVGGESCGLIVADTPTKKFAKLLGEDVSSRSTCWNPNGIAFAVTSSDKKCRIWDIRQASQPLHVLEMTWKQGTSVQFSSDGELMVVGETMDYVSIYSTREYKMEQQINFFGILTGVSLSPDDESLFIGIEDIQLTIEDIQSPLNTNVVSIYPSSLLVYHRRKDHVDTYC